MKNLICNLLAMVTLAFFMSACEKGMNGVDGRVVDTILRATLEQFGGRGALGPGIGQVIEQTAVAALNVEFDRNDMAQIQYAYEKVPDNYPSTWENPNNGYQYKVMPQETFQGPNGVCRTVKLEAIIEGKTETVVSQACRDASGRWVSQK